MRFVFFIVFLVLFKIGVSAINSPELRCVDVASKNEITLTWVAPLDPSNEFVSYEVYYAASVGGTYSLIASIPVYSQTTYNFNGANLPVNDALFYVQTKFNDGSGDQNSNSSDTLQAMEVELSSVAQSSVTISWNHIHQPTLSTHSDYNIYRQFSGQSWQLIGNTTNLFFEDNVEFCSDSIYYKVEVDDNSGCVSTSLVFGDLFVDDFAPNSPQIDSISVLPNGQIQVGWQVGTPSDVDGYIVALQTGPTSFNLDTVPGINNTLYSDPNGDPASQAETYGVLAYDNCLANGSPNTSASGTKHSTIFLSKELDPCAKSVVLNWSHYVGWNAGIGNYKIYSSKDGGAFNLVTQVNGGVTTFEHKNLTENSSYCYFVRAFEAGGTNRSSSSNQVCENIEVPNFPQQHYVNYVTVLKENMVEISCYVDANAAIDFYDFEKTNDTTAGFHLLTRVAPTGDSLISYIDSSSNSSLEAQYYRVVAIDVCGNRAVISNVSNTIFMKANSENSSYLKNTINWKSYADWEAYGNGVSYYNIYRSSSRSFEDMPVASVNFNEFTYTDDITYETENGSNFCYLVEAIEAGGNAFGFESSSKSNVVCFKAETKVLIPNAFTPDNDGLNDVFLPIISFSDYSSYFLGIYNRWGEMVFQSEDYYEGWDGGPEQDGIYIYVVRYMNENNKVSELKGTITLIR